MGFAMVFRFDGSEPTSFSVKANAVTAPFATLGRKRSFCFSLPYFRMGWGSPIDWCAESSAVRFPHLAPSSMAAFE